MNKFFYPKLAASGLNKNRRLYIPYLLTCMFTVAMFYIVKSLSLNPGLSDMVGDTTMTFTMDFGCVVIGLFALIFLFYTNSFLMKQRKKEFGLFHILGMEKHHLYISLHGKICMLPFLLWRQGFLWESLWTKPCFCWFPAW